MQMMPRFYNIRMNYVLQDLLQFELLFDILRSRMYVRTVSTWYVPYGHNIYTGMPHAIGSKKQEVANQSAKEYHDGKVLIYCLLFSHHS